MAVTIRMIAEAAGVSRGTVDKVLNNRHGISDEVRNKVKKVAAELGYKPNIAGKALTYQRRRIKVGVIIVDINDYCFQEIYKGAKQAYSEFKDFGMSVDFCIMNTDSVEEQLQYISILSKCNISALVITPLDDEAVVSELTKLSDNGVAVIIINTDIKGVPRLCFVGQDLKQSGRVAGQLIGELLPEGGKAAIITGEDKYEALKERVDGFLEIIADEYASVNVINTVKNINNNAEAYSKTEELLNSNEDLKAIYITTAKHIEGIGKAVRKQHKNYLKIVSNDIDPEIIQLMKNKIIDFTITQEPFVQGYQPIKILFEYFFQNVLPPENIYTKLEIRIKENIKNYV